MLQGIHAQDTHSAPLAATLQLELQLSTSLLHNPCCRNPQSRLMFNAPFAPSLTFHTQVAVLTLPLLQTIYSQDSRSAPLAMPVHNATALSTVKLGFSRSSEFRDRHLRCVPSRSLIITSLFAPCTRARCHAASPTHVRRVTRDKELHIKNPLWHVGASEDCSCPPMFRCQPAESLQTVLSAWPHCVCGQLASHINASSSRLFHCSESCKMLIAMRHRSKGHKGRGCGLVMLLGSASRLLRVLESSSRSQPHSQSATQIRALDQPRARPS